MMDSSNCIIPVPAVRTMYVLVTTLILWRYHKGIHCLAKFMILTFQQYYWGNQIKKEERRVHRGEMLNQHKIHSGMTERSNHLVDIGVDGIIILKLILKI
jgi:hypothetical protein